MKIIIASDNRKKIKELREILEAFGFEVITKSEAGIEFETLETGKTFEENALLKAKKVSLATGLYAIADDSGLEVTALNNEPGIFSARYAGENATDEQRIKKLLDNMKDAKNREARFVSAIAFYAPDGRHFTVLGTCSGFISKEPSGNNGFGYDPVFFIEKFSKTFAEISPEEKNSISHRGNALRLLNEKLKEFLKETNK